MGAFLGNGESLIRDCVSKRVWAEKLQFKTACRADQPFTVHCIIQTRHKISVWDIIKHKLMKPLGGVKPNGNVIQSGDQCREAVLGIDAAMGGNLSVIKVSAEVCNTVFSRHGGGKVAKFTTHLPGGQTGFDAHTGRCNIVIDKTHRSTPSFML